MIRVIVVPHWALAVVFGVLPAIWLTKLIRSGLKEPDTRCPGCGYDLRATRDRCPECGLIQEMTPPPAA